MPSIRELFPECEKNRRVMRGYAPDKTWRSPPPMDTFMPKVATEVLDTHRKDSVVAGRNIEMRRMIVRENGRYGYLCIKTGTINLSACRSYNDLQHMYNTVREQIKWSNSWASCQTYINDHCTAPSYKTRISQLRF